MVDETATQRAARHLFDEHEARARFQPLPEAFRPRTMAEAYAVQEAFRALLAAAGRGEVAGYKIAVTTPVMQRMVGIDAPLWGAIFASVVMRSPASLRGADYVRLGIECEIAVRLGADLPAAGASYGRDSVAEAVAACAPAFELVEDRGADYAALDALTLVADNAWNAGIVLGPELRAWRDIDLAAAQATMTINGESMGEGRGADALGHPFEAVAWLANALAERGEHLARDMVVMTGSIVPTRFLKSGDRATVSVDGLGQAELSVT